jgi:hypothetical protein
MPSPNTDTRGLSLPSLRGWSPGKLRSPCRIALIRGLVGRIHCRANVNQESEDRPLQGISVEKRKPTAGKSVRTTDLDADSDGVLLLLVVDGAAADGLAASHHRGAVGADAASASWVLSQGLEVVEGRVWNCFDRVATTRCQCRSRRCRRGCFPQDP